MKKVFDLGGKKKDENILIAFAGEKSEEIHLPKLLKRVRSKTNRASPTFFYVIFFVQVSIFWKVEASLGDVFKLKRYELSNAWPIIAVCGKLANLFYFNSRINLVLTIAYFGFVSIEKT